MIFFLPRSCQESWPDLAKIEIGTILTRPHEYLARSWQDLTKVKFFSLGIGHISEMIPTS